MKRKKFYILISFLTTAVIFSTAAICNQCTVAPSTTTEKANIESTATTEIATSKTETPTAQTTSESISGAVETAAETASFNSLEEFNSEVSALVDKIIPSVVSMDVVLNKSSINAQNARGVGTGIIYKEDGYVVTNNHVVGNANKITVTLYNGTSYNGTLVGADANTDIAVVKISAASPVAAKFVSEDTQKVGNFVLAVGTNSFGIPQKLRITNGIISSMDISMQISAGTLPYVDLIETNALINPGNSGGPLVNINGEVIGMNTLELSESGSMLGIGFAIPSDTVTAIADEIIKYGSAKLPYIGLTTGNNTSNIPGVLLSAVTPEGPADRAGLKAGDIITEFNDEKIFNTYDLIANIIQRQIADAVTIKYSRGGTWGTVLVVLEKRPANTSVTGS
jgi:serine protease Do